MITILIKKIKRTFSVPESDAFNWNPTKKYMKRKIIRFKTLLLNFRQKNYFDYQ